MCALLPTLDGPGFLLFLGFPEVYGCQGNIGAIVPVDNAVDASFSV